MSGKLKSTGFANATQNKSKEGSGIRNTKGSLRSTNGTSNKNASVKVAEEEEVAESSGGVGMQGQGEEARGKSKVKGRKAGGKSDVDRSYCIQMTREMGADSFEGFFDINGNRDGKGRYTWADGTIGLCSWSDGCCDVFDDACTKYSKAERHKTKKARAPTMERQKC